MITVLVEEGRKRENVFNVLQGIIAAAGGETHQDARLDLEERPKMLFALKKPNAASQALRISAFADHQFCGAVLRGRGRRGAPPARRRRIPGDQGMPNADPSPREGSLHQRQRYHLSHGGYNFCRALQILTGDIAFGRVLIHLLKLFRMATHSNKGEIWERDVHVML